MNTLIRSIRKVFEEWISSQDNSFCFTLTFKEGTTNIDCERNLDKLVRHVNQRLFTRRYQKKGKQLNGFATREYTQNGTLHFHYLINNNDKNLIEFDEIKNTFYECLPALTPKGKTLRVGQLGFDIQEYYNKGDSRLEKYITKNFEKIRMTIEDAYDSIGVFSCEGAHFGNKAKKHPLQQRIDRYTVNVR